MIVKDAVYRKAYDLDELDPNDEIRICYTNTWGDRKSLKCKVRKYDHFRSDLEDKGCTIDSLLLSH